ncbi:MAG: PAS domain-containing protein [Acidimicrobiales bacterium]
MTSASGKDAQRQVHVDDASLLMAISEISEDAILSCDRSGRVATWGVAATRLFGLEAGEVLGRPVSRLLPNEPREQVESLLSRVLRGERIIRFETETVRGDGIAIPVSVSACRLTSLAPDPVGVAVVVRDMTEQRIAQAALAEAEMRLEEAEALSHVGSWLWDIGTEAVQWSTEFHRLHGVDPLEFGGTLDAYLEVIEPEDRAQMRASMYRAVTSERPLEHTYRVNRGSPVGVIRVRAQPTAGPGGTAMGLRGIGLEAGTPAAAGDAGA